MLTNSSTRNDLYILLHFHQDFADAGTRRLTEGDLLLAALATMDIFLVV
jgi:hypothetical protein